MGPSWQRSSWFSGWPHWPAAQMSLADGCASTHAWAFCRYMSLAAFLGYVFNMYGYAFKFKHRFASTLLMYGVGADAHEFPTYCAWTKSTSHQLGVVDSPVITGSYPSQLVRIEYFHFFRAEETNVYHFGAAISALGQVTWVQRPWSQTSRLMDNGFSVVAFACL